MEIICRPRYAHCESSCVASGRPDCTQIICGNKHEVSIFDYDLGIGMLEQFVNNRLAHGRGYFTREEALSAFTSTPVALSAALTRQVKKGRLQSPAGLIPDRSPRRPNRRRRQIPCAGLIP